MEETKRSGMSKDQFWNLIEKAKEVCGTDLDASAVWIKQQLFYMTPEDVLQFQHLVVFAHILLPIRPDLPV